MQLFVPGGSGFVGGPALGAFVKAGHRVRASGLAELAAPARKELP